MPLDPLDNANPQADASRSGFAILKNLSDSEQAEVFRYAGRRAVVRGTRILTAGETSRSLHILLKGSVDVTIDGPMETRRIATIGEGSVFGEMAFLDGHPRSAHVDARDDVEILSLAPEHFEQLAAAHARLAHQLLLDLGRVLSLRLRQLNPAQ